jgi:class 3 adenylate cyclase
VRRAERLLERVPESQLHALLGAVAGFGALVFTGDGEAALTAARRTGEIAARTGDATSAALGQSVEGRALITLGRIKEGIALLDESVIAAVTGEVDPLSAAALYCNAICAYQSVGEFQRAEEWSLAMETFCAENSVGSFHGRCRVHRAEIERLRGNLRRAEAQAKQAATELGPYSRYWEGWAFSELGQIRARMGDLDGAGSAFAEADERGWPPQPGLAMLRLAMGDTDGAAASIRDAIDDRSQPPAFELPPNTDLRRAPLLVAQVEIATAAGDVEEARAAADELSRVADRLGTAALRATSAMALGAVQLAEHDPDVASQNFRDAAGLWQSIGAPFEAARARVGLGMSLRAAGREPRAIAEFRAAQTSFERLGASVHARGAAAAAGDASVGATDARRDTRSFMFTDIVRSTDLVQAMGDDAWRSVLRWHNDTLRTIVRAHHGEVVSASGDGLFVTFDTPRAGVECALAIQRAFVEHRRAHGFAPRVRIGLHEGEATREGHDWSGNAVHAAARIGALAEGDEVLASRATARAAGNPFRWSEPRTVPLRGFADPVEVVSLKWS